MKIKIPIIILLGFFGISGRMQAQQIDGNKYFNAFLKGISIYNALNNPELRAAVNTFTDSTGIRIYPEARINDTARLARMFNNLNELKDTNKVAPYIKVILVFTPTNQLDNSTHFAVQLQLEPSPDLQIAVATLQDIINQVNGLLTGTIQPENYATINTAIITALNQLKQQVTGAGDIFIKLKQYFTIVINQMQQHLNDTLPLVRNRKTSTLSNLENSITAFNNSDTNAIPVGTGSGEVGSSAFLASSNITRQLTNAEIQKLKNNPKTGPVINMMETMHTIIKFIRENEAALQILNTYINYPGALNNLISDFRNTAAQFLLTITWQAITGAQEEQLKQEIKNYVITKIYAAAN